MVVEPNVVGHHPQVLEFLDNWKVLKLFALKIFYFWLKLLLKVFLRGFELKLHFFGIVDDVVGIGKHLLANQLLNSVVGRGLGKAGYIPEIDV